MGEPVTGLLLVVSGPKSHYIVLKGLLDSRDGIKSGRNKKSPPHG